MRIVNLSGGLNIPSLLIPYTKEHVSIYFSLYICKIVTDKATKEDVKLYLEFWSPLHISMSFSCNAVNLGRFTEEKSIIVKCRTAST